MKVPLANRFATERLTENQNNQMQMQTNGMKITGDTSQNSVRRFRGCVGVKALKIHLQRKLQTSSCLFLRTYFMSNYILHTDDVEFHKVAHVRVLL